MRIADVGDTDRNVPEWSKNSKVPSTQRKGSVSDVEMTPLRPLICNTLYLSSPRLRHYPGPWGSLRHRHEAKAAGKQLIPVPYCHRASPLPDRIFPVVSVPTR